jgi:hypothetical protein
LELAYSDLFSSTKEQTMTAEQVLLAVIVGGTAETLGDAGYWLLLWVIFKVIWLGLNRSGERVSAAHPRPSRGMLGTAER